MVEHNKSYTACIIKIICVKPLKVAIYMYFYIKYELRLSVEYM